MPKITKKNQNLIGKSVPLEQYVPLEQSVPLEKSDSKDGICFCGFENCQCQELIENASNLEISFSMIDNLKKEMAELNVYSKVTHQRKLIQEFYNKQIN